ncbi:MAG: hypothetical protein HY852_16605 [Bradyrhizobium sp.]|uniref:hypothetical protein n=1 Tax=Bradyrhizobium sp. TaxID=376 RepID=UPI0025C5741B|nr:hypothetical protein [Bradyrhizobium sp.]MBI5263432.1 hypothetical protein [Bradyrhizobium sp.]
MGNLACATMGAGNLGSALVIIAALRDRGVPMGRVELHARTALDCAYMMKTGSFTPSGPANELPGNRRGAESHLGSRAMCDRS